MVYEHFSGGFRIVSRDEAVSFRLADIDDYRLFVIVPYENGFAAIGRTDKFISPAAVTSQCGEQITLYEAGPYAYVKDGVLFRENP